jgi:Putative transposase
VLEYLGRYVHRVALVNSRLESFDGEQVVFRYRDNRSGEIRHCRLPALDFIGRFLQHVLPKRFVKVRAYGLYSSGSREVLQLVRQQLTDPTSGGSPTPAPDGFEAPITERVCPHCGVGRLHVVAEFAPRSLTNTPPSIRAPP